MKLVRLPSGGTTSRVGFGGTVLKDGADKTAHLKLLRAAMDAGIRHFDVAPSYGLGKAEDFLGSFLPEVRNSVTVTTKVGLPRPKSPGLMGKARRLIRPLLSLSPTLRRKLGEKAHKMSGAATTNFAMDFVAGSVAESLKRLKTDHVDVLLLHEVTPADVSDELLRFLEDAKRKGMILDWGIGSRRDQAEATLAAFPQLGGVFQTSWRLGEAPLALAPADPFVITHGAVRSLPEVQAWLKARRDQERALSARFGLDLADPKVLSETMIAAALGQNPTGMILVSTSRAERFAGYAALADDEARQAAAAELNAAIGRID